LTDLHELLQHAAPVPPEFDRDALVRVVGRRKRRRQAIALAAVTTAAVVAIGAVVVTRDDTKAPGVAVSPRTDATSTAPSTPMVTTPNGYQALAAMPRFPERAVRTVALPELVDGYDTTIDGNTLWARGCAGTRPGYSCVSRIDLGSGAVRTLPGQSTDPVVTRVTTGDGGVFVLSSAFDGSPYHVTRLDPKTGRHLWSVAVPGTSVQGDPKARLRFGAGALWFSLGTHPVVEFSPSDGAVIATIAVPGYVETIGSVDFAFGANDVWVVGGESGTSVMRIDPTTKRVEVVADAGLGFSQSLAADGHFVWTTHHTTRQDLVRIDTADGNRATIVSVPTYEVAAGDGQTWFLGYEPTGSTRDGANHPGVVGRIDPESGRVIAVTELPVGALDDPTLIVHRGKAYVLDAATHSLTIVDPAA
jgi:streptogramin lyase